ncbi:MAG: hypothetical protein ACREN5_07420 [Gemmatimonadales bacterium]
MTAPRPGPVAGAMRRAALLLLCSLLLPATVWAHPGHGEYMSKPQAIVLLAGSALVLLGVLLMGVRPRWIPIAVLATGLLSSSVGVLALPLTQGPCRGRPSTDAFLEMLSPAEGATFSGRVPVRVRVVGGRLAPAASLANRPNEGHLHIAVDGQVTSMIGQEYQLVPVPLGTHQIDVEFVANDHATFCPPEIVTRQVHVSASP